MEKKQKTKKKKRKRKEDEVALPCSALRARPKNKNKNKKQKEKSGNPSLPPFSRIFPPLSTFSHPDLLFLPVQPFYVPPTIILNNLGVVLATNPL